MATVGDEGVAADGAAASRFGDQGHPEHRALANIAKLYQRPGLQADWLRATLKHIVIIRLFAHLIAGAVGAASTQ